MIGWLAKSGAWGGPAGGGGGNRVVFGKVFRLDNTPRWMWFLVMMW